MQIDPFLADFPARPKEATTKYELLLVVRQVVVRQVVVRQVVVRQVVVRQVVVRRTAILSPPSFGRFSPAQVNSQRCEQVVPYEPLPGFIA
jgi:hypothetical protein